MTGVERQDTQAMSRAAAFEQWSQGGGSGDAEWHITRSEAAYIFAKLRGRVAELEQQLEWFADLGPDSDVYLIEVRDRARAALAAHAQERP